MAFVNGGALPTRQNVSVQRSAVCMSATSRRDILKIAIGAAAAAVVPVTPVLADGAISQGSRFRVRGKYGLPILEAAASVETLPELVENKDWVEIQNLVSDTKTKTGQFVSVKNSLQLFKTGYYPDSRSKQRVLSAYQSEYEDALKNLAIAAKKRDSAKATQAAAEMKMALSQYTTYAQLFPNDFKDEPGAAWSSDYDFRRKLN